MTDLYKILGVGSDADTQAIRQAYLKLAGRFHPDRNPNNPEAVERFKEIQAAYEVLSDPESREQFDLLRRLQDFMESEAGVQAAQSVFRKVHEQKFKEWIKGEVAENQKLIEAISGNPQSVNQPKLAEVLNAKLEIVYHNFDAAGPELRKSYKLLLESILECYFSAACYCSESDFSKIAENLKSKAHELDLWSNNLESTYHESKVLFRRNRRNDSVQSGQSTNYTARNSSTTSSNVTFWEVAKVVFILLFFLLVIRACVESNTSSGPSRSSSSSYSEPYSSQPGAETHDETPTAPPPPPPDPCDDPDYYQNSLATGAMPYENRAKWGAYDGNSQNSIRFKTESGNDYLVLLVNANNKKVVRQAYIRGGQSYTMANMTTGTFYIMFMSGNGWNPKCPVNAELVGGFAKNRAFQAADRANDHFVIEPSPYHYTTYEVTLYSVVGGNMETHPINAANFQ